MARSFETVCPMQLYISDGIELAESKPLQEMFTSKNKTQPVREVPLATWKMLNVEGMSETVQLLPLGAKRLTGFQKEKFTKSSVQVRRRG